MPLKQVEKKIQEYLSNWEPIRKIRPKTGKAKILVGHGLDHDLDRLHIEYPALMIRYYLINYIEYYNLVFLFKLTAIKSSNPNTCKWWNYYFKLGGTL